MDLTWMRLISPTNRFSGSPNLFLYSISYKTFNLVTWKAMHMQVFSLGLNSYRYDYLRILMI